MSPFRVVIVAVLSLVLVMGGMGCASKILPPSNFVASAEGRQITLSWEMADAGHQVIIVCKTTAYPDSVTDGTQVFNGLATSYVHKNLEYGTTYYYGIWSERIKGGKKTYSTDEAFASATPYWVGPNGETISESVTFEGETAVGADGHDIALTNNPEARDPTWEELRQFLLKDQTNTLLYSDNTFVCADFAERLHNNAEKAGIRAAYVCIDFGPSYLCTPGNPWTGCPGYCGGAHACNAFRTIDGGLVFVDDTGTEDGSGADCTVSIVDGQLYTPVSIFSDAEWCPMGRASSYEVTW